MKQGNTNLLILLATIGLAAMVTAEDTLVFDFESGDLQGWKVIEGKFDYFVSDRAEFHNRYANYPSMKYNKQGKYYLSTVEQQPGRPSNDKMTGIAESPVFVLTGSEMSMLVGAGVKPASYVALCALDGNEVLKARGKPDTEEMQRIQWDAPQLVGKKVFLRLVDHETGGWGHVTFDDFRADGKIDKATTRERWKTADARRARAEIQERLKGVNLTALRSAIEDLTKTFGNRYPKGKEFLAALDRIEKDLSTAKPDRLTELAPDIVTLQREALISNPLVIGQPIVYVSRIQYLFGGHHAIDTHQHTDENNTGRFKAGGALKVIRFGKNAVIKTLVNPEKGLVREPDIHFDGKKIVFSMRRNIEEDYHIWEIDVDPGTVMDSGGSGLRQLTSLKEASDIDPIYMPDNGIVFTSTRERKYNMCSRDVSANLFRMEADGANITQITKNTLYDNHAALMPDGRILYARWEYVDRNFGDAHGLWTVNPDGTDQAIYWSNNTANPGAVFNARIIPGTHQFICIFGPHHDWLWGSLAICDRRLGMDLTPQDHKALIRIWPENHIKHVIHGNYDTFGMRTRPRYCDPYPLSDKYFLCSKETGHGVQMGIFLLDTFGNEILLHKEGNSPWGCYDAMPLKSSKRPPIVPSRRNYGSDNGLVFLQDVYQGTHMEGIKKGSIKYLRVVESPPKQSWSWGNWGGQGYQAPGMNWHSFENKRVLGTVPVEKDGSACFEVPSDKFIYFQALDENMMMVQSMRSGTILQSGEKVSCIGCHEDRLQSPPAVNVRTMAMKRAPSKLKEWHGPTRNFSYVKEVQPVFNKHCVKCHDFGKDAGKVLVLAGDRNPYFNASYVDLWLWHKKRIKCVGGGPAGIQQAYSWGSHPSLLSRIHRPMTPEQIAGLDARTKDLREKHKDVKLGKEDLDRINTWLDINAPYYPDYVTAYPGNTGESGRSPISGRDLSRLSHLTGVHSLKQNGRKVGPQISFERPKLSPCLDKLDKNSDQYREALAIIEAGTDRLKKTPRCDMIGFVACETDRRRLDRYAWQRNVEKQFRAAISEGKKLYDRDIAEWEWKR